MQLTENVQNNFIQFKIRNNQINNSSSFRKHTYGPHGQRLGTPVLEKYKLNYSKNQSSKILNSKIIELKNLKTLECFFYRILEFFYFGILEF